MGRQRNEDGVPSLSLLQEQFVVIAQTASLKCYSVPNPQPAPPHEKTQDSNPSSVTVPALPTIFPVK